MKYVLAEDFTLVTVNARDFPGGGQDAPGGLYAAIDLHAGLICLNSVRNVDLDSGSSNLHARKIRLRDHGSRCRGGAGVDTGTVLR